MTPFFLSRLAKIPLRFLADENVEIEVVDALCRLGHEATQVSRLSPGAEDEEVLLTAFREGFILLTNDKDFGFLVFRQRKTTGGVILLRMPGLAAQVKALSVSRVVQKHGDKLRGAFTVITPRTVRIRSKL